MWNDVKLAFRSLSKRPGPSLLAVMALALGIGLVTLQFSFINGIMLSGLPFLEGDRIYHLQRINPHWANERGTPVPDYLAWREQQTSFESLAAYASKMMSLSGEGRVPQRYSGAAITPNLLSLCREAPMLGRGLLPTEEEPAAPTVVLLSYAVWQRDFASNSNVVGMPIRLDGEPATIIGVMRPHFRFPVQEELWTNLRPKEQANVLGTVGWIDVVGRLKSSVTLKQASTEFNVIATRLARQWRDNEGITSARIVPFVDHYADQDSASVLLAMLVMGLGVLLIACTNVATLLLAQTARRTRELAVRAALGASRARLIVQILIESTVLAVCGAGGGILLATWGSHVLLATMLAGNGPFWWRLTINSWVLAGAIGVTLLAGGLCGLLPALQGTAADMMSSLKDEGVAASSLRLGRFNRYLVTLQMAVSCALLIVTVLLAKTVVDAKSIRPPFSTEGVLAARLDLLEKKFPTTEARLAFYEKLMVRLQQLPGVSAASLSSRDPVSSGMSYLTEVEGEAFTDFRKMPGVPSEIIGTDYFKTLNVSLLQGRDFKVSDARQSEPVTIVNEAFARRYWPNESPLGKRLRWIGTTNWATVIGVAPNLGMQGLMQPPNAVGYYLYQNQQASGAMCVLVRTLNDPKSLTTSLSQILTSLAPDQPVYAVRTLEQAVTAEASGPNTMAALISLFGGLAVFLAGFGVYGVVSFAVAQRTREFGIRFALGAQAGDVLRLILGQSARYLVVGAVAGVLLALALAQPLSALLYNVSPYDPFVYGLVVCVMALITWLATWSPARRAAKVDPLVSLRFE